MVVSPNPFVLGLGLYVNASPSSQWTVQSRLLARQCTDNFHSHNLDGEENLKQIAARLAFPIAVVNSVISGGTAHHSGV